MNKKRTRRKFSSAFKAKVALEAVKDQYTLAELAKKFDVSNTSAGFTKLELTQAISTGQNLIIKIKCSN